MDKLAKLMQDIGILWEKYRMMYLNGMLNTLGLALAATAIGCIIGLLCGILNTIPCAKNDPLPKRILLKILRVIIRIYVEVFRGTPMMLQAVFIFYALPYFTDNALRFDNISGRVHPDRLDQHRRVYGRVRPRRYHLHRPWPD